MATTKLNLPTITGNMSADVVRDVNALANGIDGKVGVANGLASLGADGKVPSVQLPPISNTASDVSITDAANYYTATKVEGALQEIGQTLNSVRGSLITSATNLL